MRNYYKTGEMDAMRFMRTYKDIDEFQGQQMLSYSQIVQEVASQLNMTARGNHGEQNVWAYFQIPGRVNPINPDWEVKGSGTEPEVMVGFWARNDWNPTGKTVNMLTEVFFPTYVFPEYFDKLTKRTVGEVFVEIAEDHLGFDSGVYYNDEGIGGDIKGEITLRINNLDVRAAADRLVKRIEDMGKVIEDAWKAVDKVENSMLGATGGDF